MNKYEQEMLTAAALEYLNRTNERGIITSSGKFEGEPIAAVALWNIALDGFADVDSTDCDGTPYYEFFMSRAELADYGLESYAEMFPNSDSFHVFLVESDSGFVTMSVSDKPFFDSDCDESESDSDPYESLYHKKTYPVPVKPQRKARKGREIDGLLISETFINQDKGYQFGSAEPYEPFTDNIGKLFRSLQREYGRCTGKVYVDTSNGVKAIGWVFEKRMQYEDARSKDDTYTREVWVTLHTAKPEPSVKYQYATL